MERYYTYSRFIKEYFGEKLYKICLDGGFTCPNRDGTLANPMDVSFAVKGEAENLQRTLPSLYLNRFVLEKHRPLKNTMGNIILLIFRHLQTLMHQ